MPRSLSLSLLIFLVLSAAAHGADDDSDSGSSSSDQPNLRAKSLILVKVWCLIIIFFATFIGGVSPCFFKWDDAFLVLGIQFSGGVFLGTAMMHFLSDSNETFEDLTSKSYPFAFMLACSGYLITMLADCVILHIYEKQRIVAQSSNSNAGLDSFFNHGVLSQNFPATISFLWNFDLNRFCSELDATLYHAFLLSSYFLCSAFPVWFVWLLGI